MDFKKRSYPLEILPLPHFKKAINIDKLLKFYDDLLVARLVKGCVDDYKKEMDNGEVEMDDTVFENSMANLSLNLAGGRFVIDKEAHLPFLAISEYGTSNWNGSKVEVQAFGQQDSYSYNVPCFGLCFRVKDIHKKTFPFHKGFGSEQDRDKYEKQVQEATDGWTGSADAKLVGAFVNKRSVVTVYGRLELHHSPTNGNYWHTTLDTTRPAETDYIHPDGKKQSSDRNMFKALKQNLLQCREIDTLPVYKIAHKYYIKWYARLIPCFAY